MLWLFYFFKIIIKFCNTFTLNDVYYYIYIENNNIYIQYDTVKMKKLIDKFDIDFDDSIKRTTVRQPIKFCVNNNPSSNNGIADCGAIRLSDLPRVNSAFLSAECYARQSVNNILRTGNSILRGKSSRYSVLKYYR